MAFQLNRHNINVVIRNNGTELHFNKLSHHEKNKLRDSDVIDLIDNHIKVDAITLISLHDCVGITDATLAHIATKCTNLETLLR